MATENQKADAVAQAITEIEQALINAENVCEPSLQHMAANVRARKALADSLWNMIGSHS